MILLMLSLLEAFLCPTSCCSCTSVPLGGGYSRWISPRLFYCLQEEKLELQKLLERVPIPVKESIEEPSAKVIPASPKRKLVSKVRVVVWIYVFFPVYQALSMLSKWACCGEKGFKSPPCVMCWIGVCRESVVWFELSTHLQYKVVPPQLSRCHTITLNV